MSFMNYGMMLAELRSVPNLDDKLANIIESPNITADEIVFYFNLFCMPPKWAEANNPLMHSKLK